MMRNREMMRWWWEIGRLPIKSGGLESLQLSTAFGVKSRFGYNAKPVDISVCTVNCYKKLTWLKQQNLYYFLPVCSLFWLAVVRLLSLSTVERQFICACSVNLARLMPETAGMRLCRFVSEEMKEHMPETTMDWVFETTFLETTFLVICSSVT